MTADLTAWAARIAAELPPFTAEEAAEAGRLAAQIDARRTADMQRPGLQSPADAKQPRKASRDAAHSTQRAS